MIRGVNFLRCTVLSLVCSCLAHAADADSLAGTWVANPTVRGQVDELVIQIESGPDKSLSASLELPQVQSRRVRGEFLFIV